MAINTRVDVKYRHIHVKVVIISYLSKQTEKRSLCPNRCQKIEKSLIFKAEQFTLHTHLF